MQKRILEVVDYDLQWVESYLEESLAIQQALKGLNIRMHHIHAFNFDTSDVVRHIDFRDYLIANQSVAAEYGALKSELAVTCNNDHDTYCDGKEEFVQHHERKALAWRACKQGGSSEPHTRPAGL